MIKLCGNAVSDGIAVGTIEYKSLACNALQEAMPEKESLKVLDEPSVVDAALNKERYLVAKSAAAMQIDGLVTLALDRYGQESADILLAQKMFLEDEELDRMVFEYIDNQNLTASQAVPLAGRRFADMFEAMDDDLIKSKAVDVIDVTSRMAALLSNNNNSKDSKGDKNGCDSVLLSTYSDKAIILADDLTPSETLMLDRKRVLAFVTLNGGQNSHTAILARTMGIPAVTGIKVVSGSSDDKAADNVESLCTDYLTGLDGKKAIVDGQAGFVYVEPEEILVSEYLEKSKEAARKDARLCKLKGKEAVTMCGKKVSLLANVNSINELEAVSKSDAEGIGLFRSEFLFLESKQCPSEEMQYEAYKKAAELMGDSKVIVRTLDVGADKKVDYLGLKDEYNPALGMRGIRVCLSNQEVFRTQLRALYRASVHGNLAIMYPMITSVSEVKKILEISKSVRDELTLEGIAIGSVEEGIMIETPAAAIISDELAKMVDFFSIGTNDLSQYTLAMDRQNPDVEELFDAYHPAVLSLIEMTINNAHKHGIRVGICGELGSDTTITKRLLDMGVDELSMTPSKILEVKETIIFSE